MKINTESYQKAFSRAARGGATLASGFYHCAVRPALTAMYFDGVFNLTPAMKETVRNASPAVVRAFCLIYDYREGAFFSVLKTCIREKRMDVAEHLLTHHLKEIPEDALEHLIVKSKMADYKDLQIVYEDALMKKRGINAIVINWDEPRSQSPKNHLHLD